MPKVTYFEFRPGRWVKLVDGKAVGPATAEEVAKWRRETTAPDRIWQDVVEEAAPSKAEPAQPAAEALAPEAETAQVRPAEIWHDVLRQATPSEAQPIHPPQVPSRAEGLAEEETPLPAAEAAPVKKAAKPKLRRATKAAPVTKAAEPEPLPAAEVVPARERTRPAPRRARKAESPEKGAEPEPVLAAEAPTVMEAAKPKPRRAVKAPLKEAPKPESAPAAEAPTGMEAAKPRRVRKTAPQKKVAEPKPVPTTEAAPVEHIVEPKDAPSAAPAEEAAEAKPARRPSRSTARRRARKRSPATSVERTDQLYLWMVAGPADDLLTTVRSGLDRYEERFSEPAGAVLCHSDDLPTLELAGLPVDVRQGKGVPPRNFWIGPK